MNARSVATILDDLAPRQGFAHDWSDVLERAGVREAGASGPASRRRKWLLLAAVVAAVLVPVAAATVAPTNDWWIFHADHGLHPVTEPVVVQTGTWDGKRWQLVVSRFAGNGIDGYCSSVMPYGSPPAASSGGCGGFIARQVRRRQTDDPGSDDDPSARSGKALRAGPSLEVEASQYDTRSSRQASPRPASPRPSAGGVMPASVPACAALHPAAQRYEEANRPGPRRQRWRTRPRHRGGRPSRFCL
jgi:hypothetical protein